MGKTLQAKAPDFATKMCRNPFCKMFLSATSSTHSCWRLRFRVPRHYRIKALWGLGKCSDSLFTNFHQTVYERDLLKIFSSHLFHDHVERVFKSQHAQKTRNNVANQTLVQYGKRLLGLASSKTCRILRDITTSDSARTSTTRLR